MSALVTVADKLGKLVPRLATPHDGEVVATVRAIGRTLQSVGLDWHDLATAISDPPKPWVVFVERDAAPAGDHEPETWEEIDKWCCAKDRGRLKQHERKFVADMTAQLIRGGEPTERQANWLRALYAKLREKAAGHG